jgi:FkbM family methyltransferase
MNRSEFTGEDGHEKLLVGLKKFIEPIVDSTNPYIVAIDVGCCVGDYIQNLKDLCPEPKTKILCFEPNPVNIATLEPKIKADSSIILYKHCISNVGGKASFYNYVGNSVNQSGNGIAGLRSGGTKLCEVDVKRLDDVLDINLMNKNFLIKFIKIDTEGNDTNVIKSFEKYLPVTKYILFECSDCLDDHRGPGIPNPMKDIVDFLSAHGFDTYRIGTKKLLKVNDEFWSDTYEKVKFWSNCFALKKGDPLIEKLIDSEFTYRF